jgi:hypothetical protein
LDTRTQRIVLETAHHRISGELTLPREGYRSRLSDFLNQSELAFVALSDVTITGLHPGDRTERIQREFVAVGSRHVHLAYPEGQA